MTQFLRNTYLAIPVLFLSVAFIALDIFYLRLKKFNYGVRHLVNRTRNLDIRKFMVLTHQANDVIPSSIQIISIAMLLGFIWKDWKSGVFLISALMLQLGVVSFTKQIAIRARPPHLTAHKIMTSGSYPSGHSASTMGMAFLISAFILPYLPIWAVAIIFIILIGNAIITAYGRLYLDMHWATDIIGGWVLSIITAIVTLYMRSLP
ncbi:MAG: phosphatase PAP2 family protein [Saccharofermentanales bacterium]